MIRMADLPSRVVHRCVDDDLDQQMRFAARRAQGMPTADRVRQLMDTLRALKRASSAELAARLGFDVQYTRASLWKLAERGLVRRVDRKGRGKGRQRVLRWAAR